MSFEQVFGLREGRAFGALRAAVYLVTAAHAREGEAYRSLSEIPAGDFTTDSEDVLINDSDL